jgi:hypothetical protein
MDTLPLLLLVLEGRTSGAARISSVYHVSGFGVHKPDRPLFVVLGYET